MSWETTQWANRQRMKDAQTQIVLLVLANCADPDGLAFGWRKGNKHWDKYLVDHCRLSRATIYRKIKELKDLALIDPQVIVHDDGRKQYVVQLDFNLTAHWVEGEGDADGSYEIGRLTGSDDVSAGPEAESAALDDAALGADSESHSETEKLARGVFRHASESHSETPKTPTPQDESHPETKRVSLVRLQETPLSDSHKKDKPQTPFAPEGRAPIGFQFFKSNYPQADLISLRVWDRAANEYSRLSPADQDKVKEAVGRYSERIRKFNRKPINPDRWIREREFERYSATAVIGLATAHLFVAEGTEAWEAWCNFLAVVYGEQTRVPKTYQGRGPRGERGLNVPSEWPLGGTGWLVHQAQWLFVERYTPNFNRYNERSMEILGRPIMAVRATAFFVKPEHKRIGRGPNGTLSASDCMGALVPLEWPPPKGEQSTKIVASDELRKVLA